MTSDEIVAAMLAIMEGNHTDDLGPAIAKVVADFCGGCGDGSPENTDRLIDGIAKVAKVYASEMDYTA